MGHIFNPQTHNAAFTGTTTFAGPAIMANAQSWQCRMADGTAVPMMFISGGNIAYMAPYDQALLAVFNEGGGALQNGGTHRVLAVEPLTDDTYHLGRNDDDSPRSFKSITLKDTSNGKHYRLEVTAGVITATDLTD